MKRIWPIVLSIVAGAVLGSMSMATYLYLYQVKVEANTTQIEELHQRTQQLERRSKPAPVKKQPMSSAKRWWQVWKR